MTAAQGSPEWLKARAGKITASKFADVFMSKKNPKDQTEARKKYMRQIVAELLMGGPIHEVNARPLEHGRVIEPFAKEAYELQSGNIIAESGFLLHPRYDFIGASPDGLVGDEGAVECKSPLDESVHVYTLQDGMPPDHIPQVQGELFVTERQWCDYISYDPRQAEQYRLYVQRIPRDDAYIKTLEAALLQFWAEVQAMLATIRAKAQ